ncbi:hypothetical protein C0Q70_09738 [Pomacea canaliculata]|uniref:Activin types I and II receptor domain-containing protein n=1 Tax=Pomacea canaliculata TaxID=400727 RepID=A0A2T7PAN9_POMCA|nr:hypothetical protein C0Q70_09738 [Pomacea canaliculata]
MRAIKCDCSTEECRAEDRPHCLGAHACYSQFYMGKLERGCIDESSSLLCENRKPSKGHIYDWPSLFCCSDRDFCNRDVVPTFPTAPDAGACKGENDDVKTKYIQCICLPDALSSLPSYHGLLHNLRKNHCAMRVGGVGFRGIEGVAERSGGEFVGRVRRRPLGLRIKASPGPSSLASPPLMPAPHSFPGYRPPSLTTTCHISRSHGQMFSARELSCSCLPAAFDLKRLEVFVGTNPVGQMTGLLERLNSRTTRRGIRHTEPGFSSCHWQPASDASEVSKRAAGRAGLRHPEDQPSFRRRHQPHLHRRAGGRCVRAAGLIIFAMYLLRRRNGHYDSYHHYHEHLPTLGHGLKQGGGGGVGLAVNGVASSGGSGSSGNGSGGSGGGNGGGGGGGCGGISSGGLPYFHHHHHCDCVCKKTLPPCSGKVNRCTDSERSSSGSETKFFLQA